MVSLKSTRTLKNIWESLYDSNALSFFDENDDFLPIFMLIKILEQKVQELVKNQRECKCKNSDRKLDKSIQKGINSPENIYKFQEKFSPNEIISDEYQNTQKRLKSLKHFTNNEKKNSEERQKLENKQEKTSLPKHFSIDEKKLFKDVIVEETQNIQDGLNIPKHFVNDEKKPSKPVVIEESENIEEELNYPIHEKRLFSQIVDLNSESDSSLDIINESCITNIETSPVLKNKNLKKSRLCLKSKRKFKRDDSGLKILKDDEIKKKESPFHTKNVIQSKFIDTVDKSEKIKIMPLKCVQRTMQNENNIRKNEQELQPTNITKKLSNFEHLQNNLVDLDETEIDPFAPTFYCPLPTTPQKKINPEKLEPCVQPNKKPELKDCYVIENTDENKKENVEDNNKKKQKIRKFRDTSYDRIPDRDDEPEFAYRRYAVRKKADRAKLKGQTCYQCAEFFKAMGGDGEKRYQENLNKCSRHRDNFAPSNTPPGFWKPTF